MNPVIKNNFYQNFSKKFVDTYLSKGREEAGFYAAGIVNMKEAKEAAPFIEAEFKKRGYKLV